MNQQLPARIQYVDEVGRQFITALMDLDVALSYQHELVAQGYRILAVERITDSHTRRPRGC